MGLLDKFRKQEAQKSTLVSGVGRMPFPAYRGDEPYIFISYAHVDSAMVFAEIKDFNENGYNVWYDEGISPGNEWTDEIADSLEKCGLFVVFITPASAISPNVLNEINYAIDEKKPFVAIHLQETTLRAGIKLQVGTKQAILKYNMTDEEYLYKYTSAFERLGIRKKKKTAVSVKSSSDITLDTKKRNVFAQPAIMVEKNNLPNRSTMLFHEMECGYVPKGKAAITAEDGTIYTAAANSFFVRSWERLFNGLAPDYNPADPELTYFSEMTEIKIKDTEDKYSCSEFNIRMKDGTEKQIIVDSPIEFVFAGDNKPVVLGRIQLKSVSFDWDAYCQNQWEILHFTMKDGSSVCSPGILTFIGYKDRPQELSQGQLYGWVSGNSWSSSLRTKRGQQIPFSQLQRVTFTDVQTERDELYDRWLTVCQAAILFKDGRSLTASLDFASLSFFVVDEFGPAEIKVEELARIDCLYPNEAEQKTSISATPSSDIIQIGEFQIEHGLLRDYLGNKPDIKLPDEVQIIGNSSFAKGASVIETVDINQTGALLNNAFSNCPNLREIRIPRSVTMIQERTFLNCPKLTLYCHRDQLPKDFEKNYGGKDIVYLDEN